MADAKSPHDSLFKKVFSNASHSAAALRTALPLAVSNHVDWQSLSLEPGSFVDEHLVSSHSDLLFSANIKQTRGLIYCLFEHQSSVDRWMPLRLLKYVLRILDRHIETTHDEFLPIVLPVVLHHSDTGWTASTTIQALFGPHAQEAAFSPF
ncbi:MAG: Rpn family recombination-promoting nuclease/putative transposase, partial [Deltaproteobacteria bacterium]|nr:Rpn family recombination-promoting nuclease/putative transposase [Deltaproteobacteria bacterium]